MKTIQHPILAAFCCIILLIFAACQGENKQTAPTALKCEYMENPIGLDTPRPRFTWAFASGETNFKQKKYQLLIATTPQLIQQGKPDLWDSGIIQSSTPRATYIGTTPLQSHQQYYWSVNVWDSHNNKCIPSPIAKFETAKMGPADWKAQWITDRHDMHYEPAPLFRKQFQATKSIKQARAYIAAAGYYELFINGQRVGENYLDPGYTHFDKRNLYVTHDITPLIKKGVNAVAAVLGNGWYNEQSIAVWDFHKARWRARPKMICEIQIQYADSTVETIPTDASWKTATGPYIYNNIYSGDMYDARLEQKGWKEATFDDTQWEAAQITKAPSPLLVAQQMPPIRVTRELEAIDMKIYDNTTYVYDFGETIAGLTRLKVKGNPGTRITLKHGELLKENGRLEQGNIDIYYHPADKKEIFQTDVYILRGDGTEEIYTPSFAYHGFRYVQVESDKPITLTKDNLTALFLHTDVQPVGKFSCSNPLLNKIWEATNRSYLSNLHSIPTDCPQREKNGWTADAHVAIDLALLNFDGFTFYEKWLDDYIDNQRENGGISGIIPSAGWGYGDWPGPVWDAALFIIPEALYNYYGDGRPIAKLYPTLQRYLAYLETKEKDGGYLTNGIGDWLTYRAQTPTDYTSTAYYYHDYAVMANFATLLQKDPTPYRQKAEEIKNLINKKYFNPQTNTYANGTQTAQALALYLGFVPQDKEQQVADKLHEIVKANDYYLDFGLLGSKTVPRMLSKYGYVEDAYKMATKEKAPSWGYWVKTMKYTTLAETWTLSPQFRDASLNHVFMGDISAWMYNYLAGLNYDEKQPGFRHIRIQPHFVKDLQWVNAEYKSVNGLIRTQWKRDNGQITLTVIVPPNTTATIYTDKPNKVGSGEHTFVIKEK